MIGFLLYCVTAAAVLFGYGFLEFIGPLASGRPPVASLASAAAPGAALLFFAGLLNLWKPRVAGFIALAGALLIWSVLFSPMQMGAFFYFLSLLVIGYVIPVLITVILVGCSTVYAGIAVIGSERFGALPAWLFPERPVNHPVGESHIQPPTAVRSAAVLLYSWLALVVVSVIQEYWRNGQMRQAGALGASVWILDFTIISAMLWIIVQISNGKNWARIISLAMFAQTLHATIMALVRRDEPKLLLALMTIALVIFSAAVVLLFTGASRGYFGTKHL